MKKCVSAMLVLAMLAIAAGAFAQGLWATVSNPDPRDRLNLRASPATQSVSYGKYYNGTRVQILSGPNNGWVHVRVGTGNGVSEIEGYMMARYLAVGEEGERVTDARPRVTVCAGQQERILLKDFISGSNVGRVYAGETVSVLGVGTTYLHVLCDDGATGMLPADMTQPRLWFSEAE